MSLRAFTPSRRALWRALLRLRSVREGALRRARNPVYRNPVYRNPYLPRLSRLLRLRALRLLRVRLVKLLRERLPRRFLLRARPLAFPPLPT